MHNTKRRIERVGVKKRARKLKTEHVIMSITVNLSNPTIHYSADKEELNDA